MRILDGMGILSTEQPTIELFGPKCAEARVCADVSFEVAGKKSNMKIKVYNTKCSMDFQGTKDSSGARFQHLENKSVGEYFAEIIIPKVVKILGDEVDLEKLNREQEKLASAGVLSTEELTCNECDSDIGSEGGIECENCDKLVHVNCMPFSKVPNVTPKMLTLESMKCKKCMMNPVDSGEKVKAISYEEKNENTKDENEKLLNDLKEMENKLRCQIADTSAEKETLEVAFTKLKENYDLLEKEYKDEVAKNTANKDTEDSVPNTVGTSKESEIDPSIEKLETRLEEALKRNECLEKENREIKSKESGENLTTEEGKAATEKVMKELDELKQENKEQNMVVEKAIETIEKKDKVIDSFTQQLQDLKKDLAEYNVYKDRCEEVEGSLNTVRQIHAETLKEMEKLRESHKKDVEQMNLVKVKLEDDLMKATKGKKKSEENERILLNTFDCMSEYMELKGYKVTKMMTNSENNEVTGKRDKEIKSATSDEEIKCTICDFKTKIIETLRLHKQTKHQKDKNRRSPKTKDSNAKVEANNTVVESVTSILYECDECAFTAVEAQNVRQHKKAVHMVKKYPCDHCDYESTTIEQMCEHKERVHTRYKRSCDPCSKTFDSREELENHEVSAHHQSSQMLQRKIPSREEIMFNGFCKWWNNGFCRNGIYCTFQHEEAPYCRYQERCSNNSCQYYHETFLEHPRRRNF